MDNVGKKVLSFARSVLSDLAGISGESHEKLVSLLKALNIGDDMLRGVDATDDRFYLPISTLTAKEKLKEILSDDTWKYQVVYTNRSTGGFAGSTEVADPENLYEDIMEYDDAYQTLILGTLENGSVGRMIDFDTL